MDDSCPSKLNRFNNDVISRYDIYNSLFTSLPFDGVYNTGSYLPIFSSLCIEGYRDGRFPIDIVNSFFSDFFPEISEPDKRDFLFRFIQYTERQVALFDAIEEAAFSDINSMEGIGTLSRIGERAKSEYKLKDLREQIGKTRVHVVLTAHPTQFYPDSVLGIIRDIAKAIKKDRISEIKSLLTQLGKTPFFNTSKPTPYDEAISLIWYLEQVFYRSVGDILAYLGSDIFNSEKPNDLSNFITLGFWPGGDRDGNPFVTYDVTKLVGSRLRSAVIRCYYRDVRKLKKRLTFKKVSSIVADIEAKLYKSIFLSDDKPAISLDELNDELHRIRDIVVDEHYGLYVDMIDNFIAKINTFGFHFATLDIRQDSGKHRLSISDIIEAKHTECLPTNYDRLSHDEKMEVLGCAEGAIDPEKMEEGIAKSTLASIYAMKSIQNHNGELGSNRYIISNNRSAVNVMEVFAMIRLCDWKNPTVDIVPLFETIDDLSNSYGVMETLYGDNHYRAHLKRRGDKQVIMLGFSDGTKDGGYLMANWSIYRAKENLTKISRDFGISVAFFDGRGGPPARGGGKTHQFYASLGKNIERHQVQLTVQGQTISSKFGTPDSCRFNLEQLFSSVLSSNLFSDDREDLSSDDRNTMQKLADISYKTYENFKNHPKFISYLEKMSTLKYYGKANMGSRPSKRGSSDKLIFEDLRAIPFVGSWSQLKQNVPGFFGVGTSIKYFEDRGMFDKVESLYKNFLFFRTLLDNSMMSITKSFFKLTSYMKNDPEFGEFWCIIYDEYKLTKKMLLKLTGYKTMMEDMPVGKASIRVRERIVLPLLTIQQYALCKLREMERNDEVSKSKEVYEKLVTRSLFGNTNASRNSV